MLSVKNVSAGYNGADVIKNITFELGDSENLCIIGPNGCGKTTLLKAIAQLMPYRGDIYINDTPLKNVKRKKVAENIALMSQITSVYFPYTVYDTVMLGRYLHIKSGFLSEPSSIDKAAVEKCLRAVNLWSEKQRLITDLSGGQLQRAFLARALVQEPKIILLDEPTNHLDLKYQIELIDFILEWAKQEKRSIIGVLHDINLAMRLSDNILLLKDGLIAAYGKTADVLTRNTLSELYGMDIVDYMMKSLKRWDVFK